MEDPCESCELEQLVPSDVEGEGEEPPQEEVEFQDIITKPPVSPMINCNKVSSVSEHSQSSQTGHNNFGTNSGSGSYLNSSTRLLYINEKKVHRDIRSGISKARNEHRGKIHEVRHHDFLTEVPDVRNMERALIDLLGDFHSGKLRAFGKGCSMQQMMDIREQQERLARLHFDLGAPASVTDSPLSADGLRNSHSKMRELVQKLEQLSVSIENLHGNDS